MLRQLKKLKEGKDGRLSEMILTGWHFHIFCFASAGVVNKDITNKTNGEKLKT